MVAWEACSSSSAGSSSSACSSSSGDSVASASCAADALASGLRQSSRIKHNLQRFASVSLQLCGVRTLFIQLLFEFIEILLEVLGLQCMTVARLQLVRSTWRVGHMAPWADGGAERSGTYRTSGRWRLGQMGGKADRADGAWSRWRLQHVAPGAYGSWGRWNEQWLELHLKLRRRLVFRSTAVACAQLRVRLGSGFGFGEA